MGLGDYFNLNNDDDEEEFEEKPEIKNDVFVIDGKKFNSVEELRKNASDTELLAVKLAIDGEICKTEKLLKKADNKFKLFGALSLVGLGFMVFNGMFSGTVKNILEIFAPCAFILGAVKTTSNFFKFIPEEDKLENLYNIYDEIDDEIYSREEIANRQILSEQIFPEFY